MSSHRRRIINTVLIVSLALNLLVFGGMAARMLTSPNGRPLPPNLSWALSELDAQTQTRLRPALEQYSDEMRPVRGALFQAQRKVNTLLTEDPLNKEAIAQAFDILRATGLEYQELSHRQTVSLFTQLSPQQRVSAMRFIQERSRPPRDRNRDRERNGQEEEQQQTR